MIFQTNKVTFPQLYMKQYVILSLLFSLLLSLSSCGNDNDSEVTPNQKNDFTGTRWSTNDWDYSIGDDWASIHEWGHEIIFYSSTEGVEYIWSKDNYSDIGKDHRRTATFFNYSIKGKTIELEYITDPAPDCCYYLSISADRLVMQNNDVELEKIRLDSDTKSWLNTIHGRTGECNWYYDLLSTLYIDGEGEMADYTSYSKTPWQNAYHAINNVKIGGGVKHIGDYCFASPSIRSIETHYSSELVSIGEGAFKGTSIADCVFFSKNLIIIDKEAFANCSYFKKVFLPSSIEEIGDFAFSGCKSASLVDTPHLKKIGAHAFAACTVEFFTNSEILEEIGDGAFTSLKISKIKLPNSLKHVGNFALCGNYTELIVGENLEKVNGTPFSGASAGGNLKVNLGTPPSWLSTSGKLMDENVIRKWRLYVPKGCKNNFSNNSHCSGFLGIYEDESLIGNPDDNPNNPGGNDDWTEIRNYKIDNQTFKMIYVEGNQRIASFWMMETELPTDSYFTAGEACLKLDSSGEGIVIKSEFRTFLENLREITGVPFRLPTVKEWQYAASGGNKSKNYKFSGSNNLNEVGWYKSNSNSRIHDVMLKIPNELGLYDMSGNYAELCNESTDICYVDGPYCGGSWKDTETECQVISKKDQPTSGNISGTRFKNKNAYDGRFITIRLVYTAKD